MAYDTHYASTFSKNVTQLSQAGNTSVAVVCDIGTQNAESDFINQYGSTEAFEGDGSHAGNTQYVDMAKARRRITLVKRHWATIVDNFDAIKEDLLDPTSATAMNGGKAMKRSLNAYILGMIEGTAWTGKDGTTPVSFPGSQDLGVQAGDGSNNTNLTVDKLRLARIKLEAADALDDGELAWFIGHPNGKESLLRSTQIGSVDYNNVKALINAEVDNFMGFKFVWSTQVGTDGNSYRKSFAIAPGALQLNFGGVSSLEPKSFIDRLPGKQQNTQIYYENFFGGSRLEEVKVVRIASDETK